MIKKNKQGWLSTWQEIADYCGVSISTAKRRHYKKGMPVIRKIGNPTVTPKMLDEWLQARGLK